MATYSAKGGADFEKVPEGTYLAVCSLVADVGLQPGSGQFPDPKVKVYFRFEIPSERIKYEKDGKEIDAPAIIYANYTASMGTKANLRKIVESWRGKSMTDAEAEQFDVANVLGATCMLQVVHSKDGKYANVKNVMKPMAGAAKLKPEGKAIYFGPDDDAAYELLPKFLKEKWENQLDPQVNAKAERAKRPEPGSIDADEATAAQYAATRKPTGPDPDDDIPF